MRARAVSRRRLLQGIGLAAGWMLLPAPAGALTGSTAGAANGTGVVPPSGLAASRVHAHTRLGRRGWYGTPEFTAAAAGFKALGARSFSRHVKTGDEDPWPANELQAIIDEAHNEGLEIIAYYWFMSEKTLSESHPEWVCRHPDGTAIEEERGIRLDMTGPYREVVRDRLLALAGMGADGFMFDSEHLPPEGCWGSPLEAAWIAETGQPAAPTPGADGYWDYIDFKARKIEETFAYWIHEVKARYPKVAFVISTTTIPALSDRQMTTRLAALADMPKNEYPLAIRDRFNHFVFRDNPDLLEPAAHVRMALGWTVLRDSAGGRPPRIWVSGVPNIDHAKAATASLLTFGAIANMDVWEDSLIGGENQPLGKTPLDGITASLATGDSVSPHLAESQPVRWAAVHFGEHNRNDRGTDYRGAWQQVLAPLVGAYQVLTEDGLPVGVVSDDQLASGALDSYRLLVLPAGSELSPSQQQAVASFRAGGGAVIENDPAWAWSDPAGFGAAATALRAAVAPYVAGSAVQVKGGPAGRYAVAYRQSNRNRLAVAVTNDFSWVQITHQDSYPETVNERAPDASGVRVVWKAGRGLPHRRAVDIVSGRQLTITATEKAYHVLIPPFAFMALVVMDDAGPTAAIDGPSARVIHTGKDPIITGTANDDLSRIASVTVRFRNYFGGITSRLASCTSGCGSAAMTWKVSAAGLQGSYTISAVAADVGGVEGSPSAPVTAVII